MITTEQDPDEINPLDLTRWSVPELKDGQTNISVFARLCEEYHDAEHCWEFLRKTASILFQTKTASCLLSLSLLLPIVMIGVGPWKSPSSHSLSIPSLIISRHFQFRRMSIGSKHSRVRLSRWSDRSIKITSDPLATVQSSSKSSGRGEQ